MKCVKLLKCEKLALVKWVVSETKIIAVRRAQFDLQRKLSYSYFLCFRRKSHCFIFDLTSNHNEIFELKVFCRTLLIRPRACYVNFHLLKNSRRSSEPRGLT